MAWSTPASATNWHVVYGISTDPLASTSSSATGAQRLQQCPTCWAPWPPLHLKSCWRTLTRTLSLSPPQKTRSHPHCRCQLPRNETPACTGARQAGMLAGCISATAAAAAEGCTQACLCRLHAAAAGRHQPWRSRCLTASLKALIEHLQPKGCKAEWLWSTTCTVWTSTVMQHAWLTMGKCCLRTGSLSDPGVQLFAAPTGWVQAGNSRTLLSNQVVQGRGLGRPCWTSHYFTLNRIVQNVSWPCLIYSPIFHAPYSPKSLVDRHMPFLPLAIALRHQEGC